MGTLLQENREQSLRDHAAGRVSWRELQRRGFKDWIEVLAGLSELGLRPYLAPMTGPSAEARQRGRERVAALLKANAAR